MDEVNQVCKKKKKGRMILGRIFPHPSYLQARLYTASLAPSLPPLFLFRRTIYLSLGFSQLCASYYNPPSLQPLLSHHANSTLAC